MKEWLANKLGHPITFHVRRAAGSMNFPWDDWLSATPTCSVAKFREAVDKGEMPLFYKVGEKGDRRVHRRREGRRL